MMRTQLLPVKIKILSAFGLMLLFNSAVFGQIKKMDNETTDQFAKRLAPENSLIVHQVLSVKWNARNAIVAFYEQGYKLSVDEDPDQAPEGVPSWQAKDRVFRHNTPEVTK